MVPAVAFASATYVTNPVVGFKVNVPWPVISITLSASQVVVDGVYKHVALSPLVCNWVPVARPDAPVIVVYVAVPPRNTD